MICFIGLDQDIVKIDNNKNIIFFGQDLVDVALEVQQSVG